MNFVNTEKTHQQIRDFERNILDGGDKLIVKPEKNQKIQIFWYEKKFLKRRPFRVRIWKGFRHWQKSSKWFFSRRRRAVGGGPRRGWWRARGRSPSAAEGCRPWGTCCWGSARRSLPTLAAGFRRRTKQRLKTTPSMPQLTWYKYDAYFGHRRKTLH